MGGVNPKRRIGVFGGTFDPVHVGHLILGAEALHDLKLDAILWVLTPDPPHKPGRNITPVEHRRQMLRFALDGNPDFLVSTVDVDRPPPHYAVDTLKILHVKHPEVTLVYLMGGDSLRDLPTWHDPIGFVRETDVLGVMRRKEDDIDMESLEAELRGITQKVKFMTVPLLDISGTEIRRRVAAGEPYRYFLTKEVFLYIQEMGLYC